MSKSNATTARKVYDRPAIFRRAWELRRAEAHVYGLDVCKISMAAPLRQAWAEAEGKHASVNAAETAAAWAAMTASDQVVMLRKCIRKAAKNAVGYSVEDKYMQFNEVPAFSLNAHDLEEYVNESWLRVASALDPVKLSATNERRAGKGKRPVTLVTVVYNAARAAIAYMNYQDSKHSAASDFDVADDNGDVESYTETRCGDKTVKVDTSAIIRADLERFAARRDDVDRSILGGLADGMTEREIAADVGMSSVAVHKRIVKMRAALRDLKVG